MIMDMQKNKQSLNKNLEKHTMPLSQASMAGMSTNRSHIGGLKAAYASV